jgi:hypothetical protein
MSPLALGTFSGTKAGGYADARIVLERAIRRTQRKETAMSDLSERIWVWRNEPGNEVVISVPDQPYPTGSPEYIRKDIADAAVKAARELEDGLGRKGVHVGSLRLKLWRALNDYDAAIIRKEEQP